MFNSKETISILVATIVVSIALSFTRGWNALLLITASMFLIILINVIGKKVAGFYLDSETEIQLWTMERFGYKAHQHFKRPFPSGILFPLVFSLVTLGRFVWMATMTFEVKPKEYRAAKRHGLYSFSEITEAHIGYIASAGIFANFLFAIIAYLLGFSEFSRLSIYYTFFNMLPFSDLDGNKIFFGNIVLWAFLAALTLIGLGYAFFLV